MGPKPRRLGGWEKCLFSPPSGVWVYLWWSGQHWSFLLFFLFQDFYLFIYLAVLVFITFSAFLYVTSEGYSWIRASHWGGFSFWWNTGLRGAQASGSCSSWALERKSMVWPMEALLHGRVNLPGSGIEPVSPALAGGLYVSHQGSPKLVLSVHLGLYSFSESVA